MERKWARTQYLASADFRETIKEFQPVLDRFPYCLIGGLAVSYYANPPVTVDIDFLVETDYEELAQVLYGMRDAGWSIGKMFFTDRRKGFPRSGLSLRRTGKAPYAIVDFLVGGHDKYLTSVIRQAKLTEVQSGVPLYVASAEDLVVLKSLAGREKDIEDVVEITSTVKLDLQYIDRMIEELM